MPWPQDEAYWTALADGKVVTVDGTRYRMQVVDCGELVLPSGKLVACDPFAAMRRGGNPFVEVPAGRYPVKVTLADVSGSLDGSHIREAYATLILSAGRETRREALPLLSEGEGAPDLDDDEYAGFGVDAGTACFVDDQALVGGMPEEDTWYEEIFDSGKPDSWFAQMDDSSQIREGIANIPMPLAKDGSNLVLFHSGWGDGVYPLVGGYDAKGNLVAVHIDFMVVHGPDD